MKEFYKDAVLNNLAETHNVAQFISFGPKGEARFKRIHGRDGNVKEGTLYTHLKTILRVSGEKAVNIRSFLPEQPRSNEFIYGLTDVDEIFTNVARLANEGLYTIVNETVDVNDGGVSGVLQNGLVEFAPGVVPRFVEKSSELVAALPKKLASKILKTVYGFDPLLDNYTDTTRLEFSLHPTKRGYKQKHTIVWEMEELTPTTVYPFFSWPTAFSKHIGDKAYGLLMADALGFAVPKTEVYLRDIRIPVFTFGTSTGQANLWTRTCPNVQVPGKYTTTRHYEDPYILMDKDDPTGGILASCLVQKEVAAKYSGALLSDGDKLTIEGTYGFGDEFMQATVEPVLLPESIINDITDLYYKIEKVLGPVRFEWAHDGKKPWILQLHTGVTKSSGRIIVPGEFSDTITFDASLGLEHLRELIKNVKPGFGIIVDGNVGMSSHIADMLRKAEIPSVLNSKLEEGVLNDR